MVRSRLDYMLDPVPVAGTYPAEFLEATQASYVKNPYCVVLEDAAVAKKEMSCIFLGLDVTNVDVNNHP